MHIRLIVNTYRSRIPTLGVLLLILFVGISVAWTPIEPRATDQQINAFCFVDSVNGWAVGETGAIIHTTDGGISWTAQESGVEDTLLDVHFTDSEYGWAVGKRGAVIRTTNGGQTWEKQLKRTTSWLIGVRFPTRDSGIIVSDNYDLLVMQTHDGGSAWQNLIGDVTYDDMYDVGFVNANEFWVVGYGAALRTTDGGRSWENRKPAQAAERDCLYRVRFVSSTHGWVFQHDSSFFRTEDAGATWTNCGRPDELFGEWLSDMDFVFSDSVNGIMAGRGRVGRFVVTTSDGGFNWGREEDFPIVSQDLETVAIDKRGNYWIGGDFGSLYTNMPISTSAQPIKRAPSRIAQAKAWRAVVGIEARNSRNGTSPVIDIRGRTINNASNRHQRGFGAYCIAKQ